MCMHRIVRQSCAEEGLEWLGGALSTGTGRASALWALTDCTNKPCELRQCRLPPPSSHRPFQAPEAAGASGRSACNTMVTHPRWLTTQHSRARTGAARPPALTATPPQAPPPLHPQLHLSHTPARDLPRPKSPPPPPAQARPLTRSRPLPGVRRPRQSWSPLVRVRCFQPRAGQRRLRQPHKSAPSPPAVAPAPPRGGLRRQGDVAMWQGKEGLRPLAGVH